MLVNILITVVEKLMTLFLKSLNFLSSAETFSFSALGFVKDQRVRMKITQIRLNSWMKVCAKKLSTIIARKNMC